MLAEQTKDVGPAEEGPPLDAINEITERSMEESPARPIDLQTKMQQPNEDKRDAAPDIADQDEGRIDLMNQGRDAVEEQKVAAVGNGLGVTDSLAGPADFNNMVASNPQLLEEEHAHKESQESVGKRSLSSGVPEFDNDTERPLKTMATPKNEEISASPNNPRVSVTTVIVEEPV